MEQERLKSHINNKHVIKLTKYFIVLLLCLGLGSIGYAKLSGSLAPEAIEQRLQPVGKVRIEGATTATVKPAALAGVGTPKEIYENNCKMCHQNGLAGAPKLGDKAAWQPRIAQGLDTLVSTAWNGIRAMPPKGNCLKCTQDDIKATVEYMIQSVQ